MHIARLTNKTPEKPVVVLRNAMGVGYPKTGKVFEYDEIRQDPDTQEEIYELGKKGHIPDVIEKDGRLVYEMRDKTAGLRYDPEDGLLKEGMRVRIDGDRIIVLEDVK
jgi:hypothetical protein